MQCSTKSQRIKNSHCTVYRCDGPGVKQLVKRRVTRLTRAAARQEILTSIDNNHTEAEVTVVKPRMYGHALGCDCVLCSSL